VIVAVVAMLLVKMAGNAIIHVAAMRYRLVAAAGSVHMARLMPTATVVGGAAVGVRARDLDHVLVDMIFVRVVKVTIMQIVDMAIMVYGRMSAAARMLMRMVGVGSSRASRHWVVSFPCPNSADTPVRLSAA
jgi:hypothetical protein